MLIGSVFCLCLAVITIVLGITLFNMQESWAFPSAMVLWWIFLGVIVLLVVLLFLFLCGCCACGATKAIIVEEKKVEEEEARC